MKGIKVLFNAPKCIGVNFIKDEGRPLTYALREEYVNYFMML
jgi:hypothetical protein